MKICIICQINKSNSDYHKSSSNKDGHDNRCKQCKRSLARAARQSDYFNQYCITKKSECNSKGLSFDLTGDYLESIWTDECPIFKHPIYKAIEGRGSHMSAHLDRIKPELGYIKGNVAWISGRANRIKYDATSAELRQIADWMEGATTISKESTLK